MPSPKVGDDKRGRAFVFQVFIAEPFLQLFFFDDLDVR